MRLHAQRHLASSLALILGLTLTSAAAAAEPTGAAAEVLEGGKAQRKRRNLPTPRWDSDLAAAAQVGLDVLLSPGGDSRLAIKAAEGALAARGSRFSSGDWRFRIDSGSHASPAAAGNDSHWGTARGLLCGIAATHAGGRLAMVIVFAARGEPL